MAPKLYSISASPPVRAVLICAEALGVQLEVVTMNLFEKDQFKEDYLKKNPQHTVPVLEDDDGFIVIDSHAIMGYLVAKYGKNDLLYPKDDYKQRAIIDHRLHFDTGILFNRGLLIVKPLLYQNQKPTQEQLDVLREAYQILEQILVNNKTDYIAGNNLTIADFSIFTSAISWTVFLPNASFPNVEAYTKRLQKIPYFEVNKEGLKKLYDLVKPKLQN